ncbi:MAG: S-layer homology domain-containing protein [Clostridiaceae bacterium]|nr:S-layer homology domain-containing protein [Clostridiaceae bacterium]
MKNRRIKIIVSVLIISLITVQSVFAQNTAYEVAAEKMVALGLLKGYEDGSLGLERNLRRVEFCAILSRMLGYEDDPILPPLLPFSDVGRDYWGYNYIATAYGLKAVEGYDDGTFKPDELITFGQAVTILVRTLGYANEVKGTKWPDNYIEVGKRLGITTQLQLEYNKPVTRGDIAVMVTNCLGIAWSSPN